MRSPTLPHLQRPARAAAALAFATSLVAGCSAVSSDDSAPANGATESQAVSPPAKESAARDASSAETAETAKSSEVDLTVAGTHLARSATLDVRVDDISKAAAAIRGIAATAGGAVTSEEISSRSEHGWGEIVVTVPSTRLDDALEELEKVGTVTNRTTSTTDESAAYTDTESRIATMRASIARIRELIKRTDDIEQLVTLEGELSTRVADLESLLAQLEGITKRTSTSPITVSLRETDAPTEPEDGFIAGLAAGWDAFTGSARVALTALGAATPFVVLGGALLAPVLVWRRRRLSRRVQPAAGAPAP